MPKEVHKVLIRFTPKEFAMVEALSTSYGDIKPSEVVRRCIEERFRKAFPVYARKGADVGAGVPEEDMTPEQTVEKFGGSIVTREGIRMATFKDGALQRYIPMNDLERLNDFLGSRLREEKLKTKLGRV